MSLFRLIAVGLALLSVCIVACGCGEVPTVSVDLTSTVSVRLNTGHLLIGNRKLVTDTTLNHTSPRVVYEFLGLPFAQPPLHTKRFQFPFELDQLLPTSTYDSTFARDSCMQEPDYTIDLVKIWNPPGNISEDCLYMNLWVPVSAEQDALLQIESAKPAAQIAYLPNGFGVSNKRTNKATLFWFYGGSFSSGTSSLKVYEGTAMAALEHVIIASSNYRVGPFGFLYLNNSAAPGNAGLADQLKAIEWYREKYLLFFGGSMTDLCLFGESAGAMSLHYHLLSDKNYLFNRLIFQSSTSYSDLTYRSPSDSYILNIKFAELVGCWPEQNQSLIACLRRMDASTLSQKQFELTYVNEYLKMAFVPTKDYHNLFRHDPATYDFNQNLYNVEHDILAGTNQNEGTFFQFYLYYGKYFNLSHFTDAALVYDNKFAATILAESLRTHFLNESFMGPEKDYAALIDCLNNVYSRTGKLVSLDDYSQSKSGQIDDFNLDTTVNRQNNSAEMAWKKISKLLGDFAFACPVLKLVDAYRAHFPHRAFLYRFNKRARSNKFPKWMGVMHGYEIEYIFGLPLMATNEALYDEQDRLISRNMISYWSNFAKTGKL